MLVTLETFRERQCCTKKLIWVIFNWSLFVYYFLSLTSHWSNETSCLKRITSSLAVVIFFGLSRSVIFISIFTRQWSIELETTILFTIVSWLNAHVDDQGTCMDSQGSTFLRLSVLTFNTILVSNMIFATIAIIIICISIGNLIMSGRRFLEQHNGVAAVDHEYLASLIINANALSPDQECGICLSRLDEIPMDEQIGSNANQQNASSSVIEIPICHHRFHYNCAALWFNEHTTCPFCRRNILQS